MSIKELPVENIETAIRTSQKETLRLEKREGRLKHKVSLASRELLLVERDLRKHERIRTTLHEAALLKKGVPSHIKAARQRVIEYQARARREDISVAEAKKAAVTAKEVAEALARVCTHLFVIGYDGHGGDQCDDYSDAYPGYRGCGVCGLTERSKGICHGEDVYNVLADGPERIRRMSTKSKFDTQLKQLAFLPDIADLIEAFTSEEMDKLLKPTA